MTSDIALVVYDVCNVERFLDICEEVMKPEAFQFHDVIRPNNSNSDYRFVFRTGNERKRSPGDNEAIAIRLREVLIPNSLDNLDVEDYP